MPSRSSPRFGEQFAAWAGIGLQSVGGGASTLFLIRRNLGARRAWFTERELAEDWAVARIAPGLSLVAYCGLLGRRVGGLPGALAALFGLLVPAALITVLMVAAYQAVHQVPAIKAAMFGMSPVALGLTIGVISVLGRTLVRTGKHAAVDVCVVLVSLVLEWLKPGATLYLLVGGAVVGTAVLGRQPSVQGDLTGDANR